MSINITHERLIPLSQVPELPWLQDLCQQKTGKRHRRLHVATVFRWAAKGVRGHRLEYLQLGGTRVTTEAALLQFFDRLTPKTGQTEHNLGRGAIGLCQRREEVERELDSAGL